MLNFRREDRLKLLWSLVGYLSAFFIGCTAQPAFIPDRAMPPLEGEIFAELRLLEQAVIDRKAERDSELMRLEAIREELRRYKRTTPEARGGSELVKLEAQEEAQAALVRVKTSEMALAIAELEEAKAKVLHQQGGEGVDLKAFAQRTAREKENLEKERARHSRLQEKLENLDKGGKV